MNEFDEMQELAQMAEGMGEGEPVIERPAQEAPKDDRPASEPMPSDMAGGLDGGEIIEEPEGGALDLEALFGVKRADDEEKVVEQTAKEPAPEQPAEPSGRDARIKELADENREIKRQLQLLTERALRGEDPTKADQTATDEQPVDEEVLSFLTPIVQKITNDIVQKTVEPMRSTIAPLAEQAQDRQMADYIGKWVPGFSAEHMPILKEAFGKFDENSTEYAHFGNGMQGATLLAQDLVSRGALNVGQSKAPRRSPLTRRLHSEASGPSRPAGADGEDAVIRAMFNASDEEFARIDPYSSRREE